MKNSRFLIMSILISSSISMGAQDMRGMVTYQVTKDLGSMAIQTDGMSAEMKQQVAEMLKKRAQKEYVLNFNAGESSWQELSDQQQVLKYKSTQDNVYLEGANLLGQAYLIRDELPVFKWVLTDETKLIQDYKVKKATSARTWQRYSKDTGVVTETLQVEAWFTAEIPIKHGPDNYWGLPGLILELDDSKAQYLCTRVVINVENSLTINKPAQGEVVSLNEYRKIREKTRGAVIKGLNGGN